MHFINACSYRPRVLGGAGLTLVAIASTHAQKATGEPRTHTEWVVQVFKTEFGSRYVVGL